MQCACACVWAPLFTISTSFVAFIPCCVQVFSIGISTNVCWTNSGQNKMDIPHNYYRMLFEPYLQTPPSKLSALDQLVEQVLV